MTEPDYLLFIASQVLTLDNTTFMAVLDDFSTRYEVVEMIKPNKVSLGGRYEKETGFLRWCAALRQEKVVSVRVFELHPENAPLAPAVAHAFAGNQNMFLSVTTAHQQRTFGLQTFSSARYAITPRQFVALINGQQLRELLWSRIAALISESNALNSRPPLDENGIERYIAEGMDVFDFDFMAGNLMAEVQVELAVNNAQLIIPPGFDVLFFKPEPSDFPGTSGNTVFLYPLGEVTRAQLMELLDAQPFAATEVWQKLTDLIKSYGSSGFPDIPAEQWPAWFRTADGEEISAMANTFCRAIAEVCEDKNIDRTIPAKLQAVFGPDDADNKRAKARGNGNDKFYLAENPAPWRMYFFETADLLPPPAPDDRQAKEEFVSALDAIADFAKEIDSPFSIPFALASVFLQAQFPAGDFSPAHWEEIKADLAKRGYDLRAIANAERSYQNASADLLLMGRPEKIPGMIAIDLADVFGGMGSWNDQYIGDEAMRTRYEMLTRQAFATLRDYLSAHLSRG